MEALRTLRNETPDALLDEGWRAIQKKRTVRARARRVRRAAYVALSVVCIVVLRLVWPVAHPSATASGAGLRHAGGALLAEVVEGREMPSVVPLSDGSVLTVDAHSSLAPMVNDGQRFGVRLARGSATFDVKPGGPRRWEVDAGIARVVVLGTKFSVSRENTGHVRVRVERGHVRVESAEFEGGAKDLFAGDVVDVGRTSAAPVGPASTLGPAEERPVTPEAATAVQRAPTVLPSSLPLPAAPKADATAPAPGSPSFAERIKVGDYKGAYADLGSSGFDVEVRRARSSADLFVLADVAKSSGHPNEARAPLDRIVNEFSGDAALAAFTRARLELDHLGAPALAATWFERALSLGLSSSLRETAMARRVEALGRAGDANKTAAAAAAYFAAYPRGHYHDAVTVWSTSVP